MRIKIRIVDLLSIRFPIKVNKRCPETIFAINRILNVKDRIKFLIISIKTINLIRGVGVPLGTKCLSILLVNFVHPNAINPIHKGNESIMFIEICLVGVKILGNKPITLTHKIIKKIEIKIEFLLSLLVFKAILNCFLISLVSSFKIIFIRVGFFQNLNSIKAIIKIKIIQFISI